MKQSLQHIEDSSFEDLLDRRIDAREREQVDAHLRACSTCRHTLTALRSVKQSTRDHAKRVDTPVDLGSKILTMLDDEDAGFASTPISPLHFFHRLNIPNLIKPALVCAGVMLLILGVIFLNRPKPIGWNHSVVQKHLDYTNGKMNFEFAPDEKIRAFFTSRGMPTKPDMLESGSPQYRYAGGILAEDDGWENVILVYQDNSGETVLCQVYRGEYLSELPVEQATQRIYYGESFSTFRENNITVVYWRSGELLCMMTSDIEPEKVVQLAFTKWRFDAAL